MNRSPLPALLVAAGVLAASAVSLGSARSLAWALAGPALLGLTVLAAGALRRRLLAWPQSYVADAIMAGGIVASGALVAFVDQASVPMMMPILGACAATALIAKRRCASGNAAA